MSLDTRGIDPRRPDGQRLLPQSLEDRLLGGLGRAAGLTLLIAIAALWLSLVSWSVKDPSLTHTTMMPPQNWLGRTGAVVSDLMLQTLGLAAILSIIAPLCWSVDLAVKSRVRDGRLKAGFYPLSVLALAGALSALPAFAAWPLHHGFGGALGDGVFRAFASAFAMINADRAGLAASLILLAAALSMSAKSTGVEIEQLLRSAIALARKRFKGQPLQQPARRRPDAPATPSAPKPSLQQLRPQAAKIEPNLREPSLPPIVWRGEEPSPEFAAYLRSQGGPQPTFMPEATLRHSPEQPFGGARAASAAAAVQHAQIAPPLFAEFTPALDIAQPGGDGDLHETAFDDFTDIQSRAIAARFAPASSKTAVEIKQPPEPKPVRAPAPTIENFTGHGGWRGPSLDLLKRPQPNSAGPELTQSQMRANAQLLEDVLTDFSVKGEVKAISPGPVVTLYEFEPARGVKSSRVIGLADDIARSMSVASVRAAIVPGRNAIGLELPNARRDAVFLREMLESDAFKSSEAALPLALGKNISGAPVVADLARMPHLLVAGTTGSGKSVGVNAMALSLLYRRSPDECRMLMIDPKMLELSVYNGIPHLLTPVVTDPIKAVAALNWAVGEMEERYKRMAAISARNIDAFNARVRAAKASGEVLSRRVQTGFDASGAAVFEKQTIAAEALPRIVIVVDEFADLMLVAGKDVEAAVQRLAQMARAAGIHLIMATQRPSVDVLTGTIKANFPHRASFKVTSKIDSRTILNEQGAEQLLGHGDMLYSTGAGQLMRVHGAFVSDEEVEAVAAALRNGRAPNYVAGLLDAAAPALAESNGRDAGEGDLYDRAVAIVLRDRKASISYIQRRLAIGYNRAADLVERMERDGVVTPADSVGRRDILLPPGSENAA